MQCGFKLMNVFSTSHNALVLVSVATLKTSHQPCYCCHCWLFPVTAAAIGLGVAANDGLLLAVICAHLEQAARCCSDIMLGQVILVVSTFHCCPCCARLNEATRVNLIRNVK